MMNKMITTNEVLRVAFTACCDANSFNEEGKESAKAIFTTMRILNLDEVFDDEKYYDKVLMRTYIENNFDLFTSIDFEEFKSFFMN